MPEGGGQTRTAEILLVEDNENDVLLTRQSFKRSRLDVNLHHVRDGVECMQFLRKEGDFVDAASPDLILLDLNMPRMNGREVLAELGGDADLRHYPVVILTTSSDEQEILELYRLRCSSYIVKPIDFDQFIRVVQEITNYWFKVVVVPHKA
jgi:two-component system response regulator